MLELVCCFAVLPTNRVHLQTLIHSWLIFVYLIKEKNNLNITIKRSQTFMYYPHRSVPGYNYCQTASYLCCKPRLKKFLVLGPLAGSYRICFRGVSHAERTAVQDRSASQTKHRDFLSVKSEELRSSTIPLNELCLTSLFVALLPHPPPPVSPLFVSSPWECQLPLVEDAAYTHFSLSLPLSLCDPLCLSLTRFTVKVHVKPVREDVEHRWICLIYRKLTLPNITAQSYPEPRISYRGAVSGFL